MVADAKLRGMRRWPAIAALVAAALLMPSIAEAKPAPKPPSFKVEMEFIQTRDWTYSDHTVGDQCSSNKEGNGSERATLNAKGIFNLTSKRRGFAGFGAEGQHTRTGTMSFTTGTPNYPGADCGGPANTTTEPTTGCGVKPPLSTYGVLDLVGSKVALSWDPSNSIPDFNPCPYYGGTGLTLPSNTLPGDAYRDVVATGVDPKELLKATKREPAVATGRSEISRVESCAILTEPCAEGFTFDANATVRTFVKFTFTPRKKR